VASRSVPVGARARSERLRGRGHPVDYNGRLRGSFTARGIAPAFASGRWCAIQGAEPTWHSSASPGSPLALSEEGAHFAPPRAPGRKARSLLRRRRHHLGQALIPHARREVEEEELERLLLRAQGWRAARG